MLAQRERVSVRRHVTDKRSAHGRIGCECQNRFNFGVLRKRLGRIDGDGRTRGIEFVRALLAQGIGYAMHIAREKRPEMDSGKYWRTASCSAGSLAELRKY